MAAIFGCWPAPGAHWLAPPPAALWSDPFPANMFKPVSTPARLILETSHFVLGLTAGIFVFVTALLIWVVVRYRRRSDDDNSEPMQIYGSNQIELSWTVIPVLLVFMLFLTTARVILGTEHVPKPANAMDVTVIGHQFWWEYRYPSLGIVAANELHIPVSDRAHPTPIYLHLASADVTHNFYVPRLAGKMDIIPNRVNVMWMDPDVTGLYLGQCAQYCGTQHAKMLLRVYVDSPEDFAAWARNQKTQASAASLTPEQLKGKSVFEQNACANCHAVAGSVAKGRFGPDLTHVASRETLASGAFVNDPKNLRQWIDNPDSLKPGVLMPPMHLNEKDLNAVTAYLTTLK